MALPMAKSLESLEGSLSDLAWTTAKEASERSERILRTIGEISADVVRGAGLDRAAVCVGVVGSIGRHEALSASDVDILPMWDGDDGQFAGFEAAMETVRERARRELSLEVSTSRDLMRCARVSSLCEPDSIGGDKETRRSLTQRVLLLTESSQAGGDLTIGTVRRRILDAYVGDSAGPRTPGRHALSVCNDVARYYRTICMDYKSRAESRPESWPMRLLKLRGPRKFWYFATLFSICSIVVDVRETDQALLFDQLAGVFDASPILRLFATSSQADLAAIIEAHLGYLQALGDPETRERLGHVAFERRLNATLDDGTTENPFPKILGMSQDLHKKIVAGLAASEDLVHQRIVDWFLL